MAGVDVYFPEAMEIDPSQQPWLRHLDQLLDLTEGWAKELGWATRRVEKKMDDTPEGWYRAPGLLMQEAAARLFLDPISGDACGGARAVVDFYLMPAYEDVARFFYQEGRWQVVYVFSADMRPFHEKEVDAKDLTKEQFQAILADMLRHVS